MAFIYNQDREFGDSNNHLEKCLLLKKKKVDIYIFRVAEKKNVKPFNSCLVKWN